MINVKIIDPYVEVWAFNPLQILKNIEKAGRVCYKSESRITGDSYVQFIRNIIKRGHESVLEHEKVTVKFVVDRGVSHELVRHRIASYSQESTRYCRYGEDVCFVRPFFFLQDNLNLYVWQHLCRSAEETYTHMLNNGAMPQEARSVLPNSLKTEVVMTANLREWRHFFKLRANKESHPQMRQVVIPLLLYMRDKLAPVFDDIGFDEGFQEKYFAEIREE